jgi:hypothetical protein
MTSAGRMTSTAVRAVLELEFAAGDEEHAFDRKVRADMRRDTYGSLGSYLDVEETSVLLEVRRVQVHVARERVLGMVAGT